MAKSTSILLGLGIGAVALMAFRGRKESLGGLGSASRTGVMGSPFFVDCRLDREAFKNHLEFFRDSPEKQEFAFAAATKCEWGCIDDREVRVARFRNREKPSEYAILAKSAKGDGGWQMNWFDKEGPYGDSPRKTQCEAIKLLSSGFRYRGDVVNVDGEPMSDWYLEEWA